MIVLVPIGPVPMDLLNWLTSRLNTMIDAKTRIGNAVPLPRNGYENERSQYQSGIIMNLMKDLQYSDGKRLVGIVDRDCYAPGLNFVFGQAAMNGREAFVALPRLRQSFYGLPDDNTLFRERTLKEIIHELGHTWGLGHCSNPDCVMFFSNLLEDTDKKDFLFCPHCSSYLDQ